MYLLRRAFLRMCTREIYLPLVFRLVIRCELERMMPMRLLTRYNRIARLPVISTLGSGLVHFPRYR